MLSRHAGRAARLALAIALVGAACATRDDSTIEPPVTSDAPSPSPSGSPDDTAGDADAAWGRVLAVDEAPRVATPTFVLDVGTAVVFLGRSGAPQGHLPGWTLDVAASYARSAPVLRAAGRTAIVEAGRIVELLNESTALDGPNGVEWVLQADRVTAVRLGQELASFDHDPGSPPVIAALRDRLSVQDDGKAVLYDPVGDRRTDLPASCAVTDVHPDVSEVMVCGDVAGVSVVTTVSAGTSEAPFASADDRALWATVGTTGNEAMVAAMPSCGGWGAWDVSFAPVASARITRGDLQAPAAMPLFWTAGGGRWVAFLGVGCEEIDPDPGVWEQDADGAWSRLGAVYPTLTAAVVAVQ